MPAHNNSHVTAHYTQSARAHYLPALYRYILKIKQYQSFYFEPRVICIPARASAFVNIKAHAAIDRSASTRHYEQLIKECAREFKGGGGGEP